MSAATAMTMEIPGGAGRCADALGCDLLATVPRMIARMWRGAVRREDADEYGAYIGETGLAGYEATPGNRGAWLLRREVGDLTEFVTFTFWDSLDAVRAFAGDDVDRAVYYPEDDRFLVERDDRVKHFEVADGTPPG
jgi:heme-degrading monooxygenase HmoA